GFVFAATNGSGCGFAGVRRSAPPPNSVLPIGRSGSGGGTVGARRNGGWIVGGRDNAGIGGTVAARLRASGDELSLRARSGGSRSTTAPAIAGGNTSRSGAAACNARAASFANDAISFALSFTD